jgi:hypothetical protein
MKEIHAIHTSLKYKCTRQMQIEFMGEDCIWVMGKTLKELKAIAEPMAKEYPDFNFVVKSMGKTKMMTITSIYSL